MEKINVQTANEKVVGWINNNIKRIEDTNDISDGYHTFGELYEHRIMLFISLCKYLKNDMHCEFSKLHNDGTGYPGWLNLLLVMEDGRQLSYHVPEEYRDLLLKGGIKETEKISIPFDGHTPEQVLERLEELIKGEK